MNYGLRYSLALIIGALFALTWFWLFHPSPPFFDVFSYSFTFNDIPDKPTDNLIRNLIHNLLSPSDFNNSYFIFYSPHIAFIVWYVGGPERLLHPLYWVIMTAFPSSRNWEPKPNSILAVLITIPVFLFLIAVALLPWLAMLAILIVAVVNWLNERASLGEIVWGIGWVYFVTLAIPLVLFFGPPFYVRLKEEVSSHPRFRRWFSFSKGGSARWAGIRSYRKYLRYYFDGDHYRDNYLGYLIWDIYLGKTLFEDTFKSQHIAVGDDAHMLTIGCTGSGKSTTALWPNIALYRGSMFIIDPKGEHARMTFLRRAWTKEGTTDQQSQKTKYHLGTEAFVLDPFNQVSELPQSKYNPLADIDIQSDRARGMLSAISDACVLTEGAKNQHFVDMAALLLEGVIAHVLSKHPGNHHNLPYVCDLLIGFDPELGVADPDKLTDLLIEMRMNDVAGKIAQLAASKVSEMGDNEKGSVLSTLTRSVKWITDPAMRQHLSGSDFSINLLAESKRCTIYVVLPFDQMKEQVRWLRTVTNVAIGLIQNSSRSEDSPVVFILDEFPMMGGKLKKIEEGIVTLRSAGVKLWPIIQNIGQLKRDYDKNWETFVSSSTVQLFGVKDLETAQWASQMLGKYLNQRKERNGSWKKRIVQEDSRDFATPEEIREELGKARPYQYVFPMDGLPMRLHRLAYKPIEIDGTRFKGLPLDGHFED